MKATYSTYKDTNISWLPQLPEHWILSRVKNHFTFPKNVAGENFLDYKVLSLSIYGVIIRDMESGKGKFSLSMDTYQVVNPNSIILCLFDMDVTPRIVGYCNDLGIITSAYTIILPQENVCAKYFYYYFLTQDHNKSLFAQGTGVRTTLTNFQFGSLPLPLPPMEEQTSIANYLDEQDEKINLFIAKKQKLIALLKEQKQAIINKAVTKGIDGKVKLKPSNNNWLGEIPIHWQLRKLRFLSTIVRGGSPRPAGDPKYFSSKGVNWITVGAVTKEIGDGMFLNEVDEFLTEEGKNNSRFILKGTLLYSNSGATLGIPRISNIDGCINDGVVAFLNLKTELVNKYFLYFFLGSLTIRLRTELNVGATQPNLNTDKVKSILMCLPEIEEQQSIVEFILRETNNVQIVISKIEKEIELIKEYRQSIVAEVVTGKIKVAN